MTTVVAYTWARDTAGARVLADGTVDWRGGRMTPGEDDPAAMAVAGALAAGRGDDEVVGVTVGNGDASWALARGATRAVSVTDVTEGRDESVTAAALAAAVRQVEGADVLVVGDATARPAVVAALAGHLGWPVVLGVTSAQADGATVLATRSSDEAVERLRIVPPVVLGVAASGAEHRTPGMKEQLAARKRPVQRLTAADAGLDAADPVALVASRVPQTSGARLLPGDPMQAATALVAALRAEGVA